MAVTLAVSTKVLMEAKARWDDGADELDGTWRRLHRTGTSGFSSEVAAAVVAFREPWVDELKAAGLQAQGHSDAIVLFLGTAVVADAAEAERLRSLLPWAQRGAAIVEVDLP